MPSGPVLKSILPLCRSTTILWLITSPKSRAYAKFPIEEERKTVKKLLKVVYCYSLTNDPYAYPNKI